VDFAARFWHRDYNFSATKAADVTQINAVSETLATIKAEMIRVASTLPKWSAVISIYGVGEKWPLLAQNY
jgi:hypothetical protein